MMRPGIKYYTDGDHNLEHMWDERITAIRQATGVQVHGWAEEAKVIARRMQDKSAAAARRSFEQWAIDSLHKGARAAHRWTKGDDGHKPPSEVMQEDGTVISTPLEMMEHRAKYGEGFWKRHGKNPRRPPRREHHEERGHHCSGLPKPHAHLR